MTPLAHAEINQFLALREQAVEHVSKRSFAVHADLYRVFGARGVTACREDLGYTLDFMRPALEFGLIQPFIDYLRWISEVLSSRGIPATHVPETIDWLGDFFGAEMNNETGAQINAILKTCSSALTSAAASPSQLDQLMPEPWPEYLSLMSALLAGDAKAAKEIFDAKIQEGHSVLDAEIHLIQPALYQVGKEWQRNTVSVAEEHLATATAMALMAQAFISADIHPWNGKVVICACVEGNHHAVGLRIVADAFEINGWKTYFLGTNVPANDLVSFVRRHPPNLICLSASMPDHLPAAKQVISRLRTELETQMPAVMLGGIAINSFPPLARIMGADATASNAIDAVQEAGK